MTAVLTDSQGSENRFDVLVIGGGHAGIEAALAAAKLGCRTAMLTGNVDSVGQMSCNPAIGGVAKGQIAREIDALGGAMGLLTDAAGLQFRMLNRGKGPAMHSPRAQCDKRLYQTRAKLTVERQENLALRQEFVEDILIEGDRVVGLVCRGGIRYSAQAVVVTTGTFLKGLMHTGELKTEGGRAGDQAAVGLSGALQRLGIELRRFKTGTPPRINGRTIDFQNLEEQPGEEHPQPFSFLTERISQRQLSCHITYTSESIHDLIRANLHRAPMYSGQVESIGPRYCPSIEDKVVRFADRPQHQIFLEPEGYETLEYYCNGISTSLPRDVQVGIIRQIPGLQHAEIMRFGYAVEYDFAPPEQLRPTLETKGYRGLFLAGQINGTTGYEEAGGQGILAGINAARAVLEREPLILRRDQAYLGVLIDDLVTRGVDEPYRMFTSRAEYRLLLRHDNADARLTEIGRQVGLVDDLRWTRWQAKRESISGLQSHLESTIHEGESLLRHLKRTETTWDQIVERDPRGQLDQVDPEAVEQVLIECKYGGYIARQAEEVAKLQRLEAKRIPATLDYQKLSHLRFEAREKLARIRPESLGQASRISGINPSDIATLLVALKANGAEKRRASPVV